LIIVKIVICKLLFLFQIEIKLNPKKKKS